jgi:hypothetical protein
MSVYYMTTDQYLMRLFLWEIQHQCEFAEIAYQDFRNSSDTRRGVLFTPSVSHSSGEYFENILAGQ